MAFTFTVEDGTGLDGANSYASVAAADDYHAAHVSGEVWSALTTDQKQAALAMATRVLDACCKFSGYKKTAAQPLQWPRVMARDTESYDETNWPDNAVPKPVVDATCEQARLLTVTDRTADPEGSGLKRVDVFEAIEIEFDRWTAPDTVTKFVADLLRKVGTVSSRNSVNIAEVQRA